MKKLDLNKVARATPCLSLIEAWQDETYIVQVNEVYHSDVCDMRMSVRRNDAKDGITWDEIQRIKKEIGFGDKWAVELYPKQSQVMNNMNVRHIFLLNGCPDFAWITDDKEKMLKQLGYK